LVILFVVFIVWRVRNQLIEKESSIYELESRSEAIHQLIPPEPEISTIPLELTESKDSKWEIPFEELQFNEIIEEGGYGIIYKGQWRGSFVAIKKVRFGLGKAETADALREARILMRLRPHSNIVQLQGISVSPQNEQCIIFEYCAGKSVKYILDKGVMLERSQIINIARGIAAGILHLHLQKITHRDLAARNILLDSDLNPKISDFGFANNSEKEEVNTSNAPIRWWSPESVVNHIYTEKSDVWSYGCILFEITTNLTPFENLSMEEIIEGMRNNTLSPLVIPEHWSQLNFLMLQCMKYDPNERPDFKEIVELLKDVE